MESDSADFLREKVSAFTGMLISPDEGWSIANEADHSTRRDWSFGLSLARKMDIGKDLPLPTIMSTFSLLQLSLEQKIDRRDLEDASFGVTSVSRPDCAMLHRQLYGIVISNLPEEEARTFQEELAKRDFPTLLVPDSELPLLPDSFHVQGIELIGENLVFTDSLGHSRTRPVAELEFLAAGVVSRLRFKSEWNQHLDFGLEGTGNARLVTEHELYEESELEFRLDFFFGTSPRRQHASASADSTISYRDATLRLRDMEGLRELATAMAALLTEKQLSSYFRNPASHPSYRTLRNYQNEIRWHLHGLEKPAAPLC